MRAALPYVDRLVAGHSLAAMQELAGLLDGRAPSRADREVAVEGETRKGQGEGDHARGHA